MQVLANTDLNMTLRHTVTTRVSSNRDRVYRPVSLCSSQAFSVLYVWLDLLLDTTMSRQTCR
jgi:hypothetical protein